MIAAAALAGSRPAPDPVDRWAREIAGASSRFGIPKEWIRRVIRAESGGRTSVGGHPIVSSAGAIGLMQLMPGTWNEIRLLLGLGDDPRDPNDNILAGTFYLRSMYDRFGYPGLFAAYNAGPARYSDYLSGSRPLPAETRAYAKRIAGRGAGSPEAGRAGIFAVRTNAKGAATSRAPSSRDGLFADLGSTERD
jgi:soluble lytic murein transglycosylase-like protein